MVRLAVLCWAGWSWCGVVVAVSVIIIITVLVVINVVCKEECAGLDGALSFTYYGKRNPYPGSTSSQVRWVLSSGR